MIGMLMLFTASPGPNSILPRADLYLTSATADPSSVAKATEHSPSSAPTRITSTEAAPDSSVVTASPQAKCTASPPASPAGAPGPTTTSFSAVYDEAPQQRVADSAPAAGRRARGVREEGTPSAWPPLPPSAARAAT